MNKEGGIYKLSVDEGQKRHKNVDVLSYFRQYAVEKNWARRCSADEGSESQTFLLL